MDWTKPEYTRSQVDKAGELLTTHDADLEKINSALTVLNNWRSAHSFPMNTFQIRLRRVSKSLDRNSLIVQRLKRVPSIIRKLERRQTNTMKLSQMQDIGGCRSVLSSVKLVKQLRDTYYKKSRLKHKRVNEKDYIQNPKADGYRSIHLIYQYKSDKKKTYNGLLIELQIRSRVQHAWATAVETVDLFTNQAIKSNEGKKEWMDFFRLVSSAFANMEGEPAVPATPIKPEELHQRITELTESLKVFPKMEQWAAALQTIEPEVRRKHVHFFLLELDVTPANEKLKITGYPKELETSATEDYLQAEKDQSTDPKNKDVVLVGADSIDDLKKAYPNYFSDTTVFLNYLTGYLTQSSPGQLTS
ncbi:MAG: RelA/SpoT domain-containing protein [Candidatus Micrarchaeota archaeon]|nr:RelA/SpoT domain-containing protein [Candidatus Micrarchaeota archaeon]